MPAATDYGVELDLPTVERVKTNNGSHIEPPFDKSWSQDEKLAWHAAVTAVDTGLSIRIFRYDYGYNLVIVGTEGRNASIGNPGYDSAWTYLSGISVGVRAVSGPTP